MDQKIKKTGLQVGATLLVFLAMFLLPIPKPLPARAIGPISSLSGEIPYGGIHSVTIVCTCSANMLLYLVDYKTNQLLQLIYQPGASVLFERFSIYGRYLLGSYVPGAGQCKIYVGEDCIDLNSDGQMGSQPGTGTSI